ncbi:hypothetical protein A2U01_0083320, partial [Trifolium medium]|nr:hypothetical protein [Trifolium medium]
FIHLVEEAEWCHKELAANVFDQTWLAKESIRVQEEILAISFNEEETVDGWIEALEDNLKPLLK